MITWGGYPQLTETTLFDAISLVLGSHSHGTVDVLDPIQWLPGATGQNCGIFVTSIVLNWTSAQRLGKQIHWTVVKRPTILHPKQTWDQRGDPHPHLCFSGVYAKVQDSNVGVWCRNIHPKTASWFKVVGNQDSHFQWFTLWCHETWQWRKIPYF